MTLPDPRQYPPVNARNPVIRQLMSLLTEHDETEIKAKRSQLLAMISELLAANDHSAINAALTQAPAQEAWLALWQTLCTAVEAVQDPHETQAMLFALPVILVAGSTKGTGLPCKLADPDSVLQILRDQGVLARDAVAALSPELVSLEALATISPARLYRWKNTLADSLTNGANNPFGLSASPIQIKEESAWLRFIVGAVRQPAGGPTQMLLGGQVGKWGLQLSQNLGEQLKTGDATVLAIPRTPQGWLAAQENGRNVLQETRLQLLASSAIRTIRSKGRTPVAIIAAHESDEIRITLSSREDAERWQGFVWPLAPADRMESIADFAQDLFRDCQVDDIRLIDAIQPDQKDGLPFFVTAHFDPVAHH